MAALVGREHKRNAEKINMVISMAPREGRVHWLMIVKVDHNISHLQSVPQLRKTIIKLTTNSFINR